MFCKLTPAEETRMKELLCGVADDPSALEMRQFIQHGTVTTYEHCLRVARIAYWLNLRFGCRAREASLLRGAFLHDFYLYDWHACRNITRWHGFKHPLIARYNAETVFRLNETEKNIIQSHMWPLTPMWVPRCREAVLVCLADKMSSTWETIMERSAPQPAWQHS
ncbi:HD domain-containing protein [uncultured Subdoligranulum sp.]|uniref:HD domain-containing protein n=1 Tax=uncultured Subdoligranulum sp. TaxID=512298 RepID=UPI002621373A|nr:HD domain-containing protein [uncultured Subdoligranulum sp.]